MLRMDFEAFKNQKYPTEEDYRKLLTFTERVLRLLVKERRARSALSKKNRKLARRPGE